jgi:hypothetical protein
VHPELALLSVATFRAETCALSTAAAASLPIALPAWLFAGWRNHGSIASITAGSTGVVA